jgi:endonuclease I
MRHLLFALLLLPFTLRAQAPPGYYDATYQLSGPALRQALYQIISGHTVVAYSQLWAAFEVTDRKQDDSVWDIYSDVPGGQSPYVYQFGVDQCGTYNSEGDCFNREHSFPQSWYNSAVPMNSDLFHIYPADAWVNQQRGNLPFGTVANANWTSMNGGKRGECSWPGCSGTVFEPINAYKGDLARSFFYMLTRYLPQLSGWSTPMMSGGDLSPWAVSLLLAWHQQDPVSQKEIDRNNAIYALQGNRNPFIDQPQWAHYIWGPTASVAEVARPALQLWYAEEQLLVRRPVGNGAAHLTVYSSTGAVVFARAITTGTANVDVQLPAGMYTAQLVDGARSQVLRFVR